MILSRYLTKEVFNAVIAVTFILLVVFLSQQLVRYLGNAAAGKIAASILFKLLGLEIPYLLALLLPLALYLGIILAYGRLYADSEMRIMHACGLSTRRLILITSKIVIGVACVIFVLTLWINPLIAAKKDQVILDGMTGANMLDTLMPGRFLVSNDGRRVIYVDQFSRDRKQVTNLFIADQGKRPENEMNPWVVISANQGMQSQDKELKELFFIAKNGYRYDGVPGQNEYRIIRFQKYAVHVPSAGLTTKRDEQEALPTPYLWQTYAKPKNAAELQWRLSMPLSAFLLSFLAIAFAEIKPRQGRYVNLLPAVLIYIVYVNLLFVARNWIEQGTISIQLGMWWVHLILVVLLGVFVLLKSRWNFKRLSVST